MERVSAASFTQPLTRTDALYFSVTVFTTVRFGDITAKSETARVVLIVQMLGDLALLGVGARVRVEEHGAAGDEDAGPVAETAGPALRGPHTQQLIGCHVLGPLILHLLSRLVLGQAARGVGDRSVVTHAEDGERGAPRRSLAQGP